MEEGFKTDSGTTIHVYPSQHGIEDILQSKVDATDRSDQEDPFFVVNLGRLAALYNHVCYRYKCAPSLRDLAFTWRGCYNSQVPVKADLCVAPLLQDQVIWENSFRHTLNL